MPVNDGVRTVNVSTNLDTADYDGLQTQVNYRGSPKLRRLGVGYTLSKATNTDGTGWERRRGQPNATSTRLGEEERGPSILDQRHRAVHDVDLRMRAIT